MPFNSSAPVMYYDKNAFKEVGLDPDKPPQTYDEIFAAAQKLVKKDASGKIIRSGVDFTLYGWILEQEMATQDALYADPDNGRGASGHQAGLQQRRRPRTGSTSSRSCRTRAWAAAWGAPAARPTAPRWAPTSARATRRSPSRASLLCAAGARQAKAAGGKVDIGVAYLPKPAGAKGGVIIGGASLWITDQGTTDQQQGAWEFVKFIASPKSRRSSPRTPATTQPARRPTIEQVMKDALAKYPQFQKAVDELQRHQSQPGHRRARCSARSPAPAAGRRRDGAVPARQGRPRPRPPWTTPPTKPTTTWTSTTPRSESTPSHQKRHHEDQPRRGWSLFSLLLFEKDQVGWGQSEYRQFVPVILSAAKDLLHGL